MSVNHITVGKVKYKLFSNFDFIKRVEDETEIRAIDVYEDLYYRRVKSSDVLSMLTLALNVDVSDEERDALGLHIFNQLGIVRSYAVISDLLHEVTVGVENAKKLQLQSGKIYQLVNAAIDSRLMSLKNRICVWAGVSLISVASLCGIFSFFDLPFSLLKELMKTVIS